MIFIIIIIRLYQQLHAAVNLWLIKMQSLNGINVAQAIAYEPLFIQGVEYANVIVNLITSVVNLSVGLGQPLTKSCVIDMCRHIELLKAIQMTYHLKREFIALGKQYSLQVANRKLLSFIMSAKVSVIIHAKNKLLPKINNQTIINK